jgi:hypothetical protein
MNPLGNSSEGLKFRGAQFTRATEVIFSSPSNISAMKLFVRHVEIFNILTGVIISSVVVFGDETPLQKSPPHQLRSQQVEGQVIVAR